MIFESFITNMYKSQLFSRQDDTNKAYYFSCDDFEGLNRTPYRFKSSKGHMLQGYFYSYENPIENRIIVFDHGFGEGHRAYIKEIEMLCRKGYLVFSYDHTGCMESEGENCGGLSQSLVDLNNCLTTLKKDEKYKHCTFAVMGHSWGGYSSLNISRLHSDLSHVIVLAGPISVKQMINYNFKGILSALRMLPQFRHKKLSSHSEKSYQEPDVDERNKTGWNFAELTIPVAVDKGATSSESFSKYPS